MTAPRIALVHAVTVAIDPVRAAFAERWPEATVINLLDDSLSPDRARDGDLTDAMSARIAALGDYAQSIGVSGILFTCSAFGPAIEAFAARCPLPVLKPNEAMFRQALGMGRRIRMLATFSPSVASMEAEFRAMAEQGNHIATIETLLVEPAMAALRAGDEETHNRLLAEAARGIGASDAVLLAHFSTSRALDAVKAAVSAPVLTSPGAAVDELKARCGSQPGA